MSAKPSGASPCSKKLRDRMSEKVAACSDWLRQILTPGGAETGSAECTPRYKTLLSSAMPYPRAFTSSSRVGSVSGQRSSYAGAPWER